MVIAWLSLFVPPESVPGRVIFILILNSMVIMVISIMVITVPGGVIFILILNRMVIIHPYDGPWQSEFHLHYGHLGHFHHGQKSS